MIRLTALFGLVALSGCTMWTGAGFYTRAEQVQPFADLRPGWYQVVAADESGKQQGERVRWTGSRFIDPDDHRKRKRPLDLLFASLAGDPQDSLLVQISLDGRARVHRAPRRAAYGIVQRTRGGVRYAFPDCGRTRDIVIAAGGIEESTLATAIEPDGGQTEAHAQAPDPDPTQPADDQSTCHFPTRASLEAASRALLRQNRAEWQEVTLVPVSR